MTDYDRSKVSPRYLNKHLWEWTASELITQFKLWHDAPACSPELPEAHVEAELQRRLNLHDELVEALKDYRAEQVNRYGADYSKVIEIDNLLDRAKGGDYAPAR